MKLSDIAIDTKLAEDGVWVTMSSGWAGLIRSANNRDARRMRDAHIRKHRRLYARGASPPPEVVDEELVNLIVSTILMDWKGIEDDHGAPIPYSKEVAKEILSNPAYRELLDDVSDAANLQETFRQDAEEADTKA